MKNIYFDGAAMDRIQLLREMAWLHVHDENNQNGIPDDEFHKNDVTIWAMFCAAFRAK